MSSNEKNIKKMFNKIANNYDFLNRSLSFMVDTYWRKILANDIIKNGGCDILDVACGTGDVMLSILNQKKNIKLTGVDFSLNMLKIAKKKTKDIKEINLIAGDGRYLPFKDKKFDAVSIAFGIRNIKDKLSALKEFKRVLKKNTNLYVLELTIPQKGILRYIYLFYFQKILPILGGIISKNISAYKYLPESVKNFPSHNEFENIMKKAGFTNIKRKKLSMGLVTIYRGKKE